jgi:hypothetical protein
MTHPNIWWPVIFTIAAFLFPFLWPNKDKFTLDKGAWWFMGCWFYGLIATLVVWIVFAVWLSHWGH